MLSIKLAVTFTNDFIDLEKTPRSFFEVLWRRKRTILEQLGIQRL